MYFKSTDNSDGFFPLSENFHENGILKKTIAPAILNDAIKDELKLKTKKLSENLNFYGRFLLIIIFIRCNGNFICLR